MDASARPPDLARRGDLIEVRVEQGRREGRDVFTARSSSRPVLEGAVVAIENRTGQVLAMVGGTSFERSQFNRATQAMRQVGSLFKPFVYTAAIDRGYTAQSELDDAPVSFNAGPGQPPYEPKNYDREYPWMDHAAPGARGIAQRADDPADGGAWAERT